MIFKLSSTELYNVLQNTSKVIAPKQTMQILDHFLFDLKGNKLKITATDLESTIVSEIEVENVEQEGKAAVPAKLIMDSLRALSDQPVTFNINQETNDIFLKWESGDSLIPGLDAQGYPEIVLDLGDAKKEVTLDSQTLFHGINKTVFAAANSDTRVTLNGVLMDMTADKVVFVATDAHQLVKLVYEINTGLEENTMVIVPRKAAGLLKGLLDGESAMVTVEFGGRNIVFSFEGYTYMCRMIEGRYPNYNSVIPQNNPNRITVDRSSLLSSVKRVSVYSNQGNDLVKMSVDGNKISLEAKDVDFSTSAKDSVVCSYEGIPMTIGIKSRGMIEMLSAIKADDVIIELSDATRAMIIVPSADESSYEKGLLMLMMPVVL